VTYDLDPELAVRVPGLVGIDFGDVAGARAALRAVAAREPPRPPAAPVEVTDVVVPGSRHGPGVPVRTYRPLGTARRRPVLIYLHWGGYVCGDLDSAHPAALHTADLSGAVVVSVDYRLAPEHPYPAGLEDCYAALVWAARSAERLGGDPRAIGVAGESAGGGLAAGLTLLARDRSGPPLVFQCLASPQLDDRLTTVSARGFTDTPKLTSGAVARSWAHYLRTAGRPGDTSIPLYAAPARAGDLRGLPPAFISVCEFDPLRDEGIAYAQRLLEAGVSTEVHAYAGTFHAAQSITDAGVSQRMRADQIDALRRNLRARGTTDQGDDR
jgi:acetyl esterase